MLYCFSTQMFDLLFPTMCYKTVLPTSQRTSTAMRWSRWTANVSQAWQVEFTQPLQATVALEFASKSELVGGFNPANWKIWSANWIISQGRGKNKNYLKPTPREGWRSTKSCEPLPYDLLPSRRRDHLEVTADTVSSQRIRSSMSTFQSVVKTFALHDVWHLDYFQIYITIVQ